MMIPVAPFGQYYSEKAPFLSIVAAVCAGTRSERARFSVGHGYYTFCKDGYGLTPNQTHTLVAAAATAPPEMDFACVPTPEQLEAIIDVLEAELNLPEKDRVRSDLSGLPPAPPAPPLDPLLAKMFPTLIALYSHYILGQGAAPVAWREVLRAEFWPELAWIW